MFIFNKLELPAFDKVLGKIVDAPNPPLDVLERIFLAAEVALPTRVACDWGTGNTLCTNFNGGFLYIPIHFAYQVSQRWRGWAEWLFKRPELFDKPEQIIHVDQIAMALALASGEIPFNRVGANFNFPVHVDLLPSSFKQNEPLRVLHYHQCLSNIGRIESKVSECKSVILLVEQINEAIVNQGDFSFSLT